MSYEILAQELVEPKQSKRFLGERGSCRYCGARDASAFGRKEHAHTFPEALGNQILFSLDECKACNEKFSLYEDALAKAVGPYLTFGGVRGKKGVRQTGRSSGPFHIKHTVLDGKRRIGVAAEGSIEELIAVDKKTGRLKITIPVQGDRFVPQFAYKALQKMAIGLLPDAEISGFENALASLRNPTEPAYEGHCPVGFSYAYIGNAVPALAGTLLRRVDDNLPTPYMIFIFVAGSVCFQIWLRSDQKDRDVPVEVSLRIKWTSQLPKLEGGYYPIHYSEPMQFDWASSTPQLQPFEAFELFFDQQTTEGYFKPVRRIHA